VTVELLTSTRVTCQRPRTQSSTYLI